MASTRQRPVSGVSSGNFNHSYLSSSNNNHSPSSHSNNHRTLSPSRSPRFARARNSNNGLLSFRQAYIMKRLYFLLPVVVVVVVALMRVKSLFTSVVVEEDVHPPKVLTNMEQVEQQIQQPKRNYPVQKKQPHNLQQHQRDEQEQKLREKNEEEEEKQRHLREKQEQLKQKEEQLKQEQLKLEQEEEKKKEAQRQKEEQERIKREQEEEEQRRREELRKQEQEEQRQKEEQQKEEQEEQRQKEEQLKQEQEEQRQKEEKLKQEELKQQEKNNTTIGNENNNNTTKKIMIHKYAYDDFRLEELPEWIVNYIQWHRKIRMQYPGAKLLTDPNAPNVLIRVCLGLCGGLNDRLGQLPWDLYLANQTGRILLMRWDRPKPLEDFLMPNAFNWSVPPGLPRFADMKDIRNNIDDMFEDYAAANPTEEFWNDHLDKAIYRAKHGNYSKIKILRHRLLGHLNEDELEKRLAKLGEKDMIHNTLSFGKIFWMFFKPGLGVKNQLEGVYDELQITPGQYSAVHCRVRHPKATTYGVNVKGKWAAYPADKTGLPWEGGTRHFAIETAINAIKCSKYLLNAPKEPIYFFSDSNDLVHYISHQLKNNSFVQANRTIFQVSNASSINNVNIDDKALRLVEPLNVIAREMSMENAHIDRQKGRPPSAYYATFVDLFLAIHARCVTYGIGFYAVFATKISGTSCKLLYTEESWGGSDFKVASAPLCSTFQKEALM